MADRPRPTPPGANMTTPADTTATSDGTTETSDGMSADTTATSADTSMYMTEMSADSTETSSGRPSIDGRSDSSRVSADTTETSANTTEVAADSTASSTDSTEPALVLFDVAVDKLCRLCLMHYAMEMQRLFDDSSISDNIMALAQIKMCEGDGLPEQVCQHCLGQMKASLAFVSRVRRSDRALKEYVLKLKVGAGSAAAAVKDDSTTTFVDGQAVEGGGSLKNVGQGDTEQDEQLSTDDGYPDLGGSSILSNLLKRPPTGRKLSNGGLYARRNSSELCHNNNNNNDDEKCDSADWYSKRGGRVSAECDSAKRDTETASRRDLRPAPPPGMGWGGWGAECCDSVAMALCSLQSEARRGGGKDSLTSELLSPRHMDNVLRPGNVTVCFNNIVVAMKNNPGGGGEGSAVGAAGGNGNVVVVALVDASHAGEAGQDNGAIQDNTNVALQDNGASQENVAFPDDAESESNEASQDVATIQDIGASHDNEEAFQDNRSSLGNGASHGNPEIEDDGGVKTEAKEELKDDGGVKTEVKEEDDGRVNIEMKEELEDDPTTGCAAQQDKASCGEIFFFDVQEEVIISDDVGCEEVVYEGAVAVLPSTSTAVPDAVPVTVVKTEVVVPESGDYIFACELCSKAFKRKKALLSHMKMHTLIRSYGGGGGSGGGRPVFKCDVCHKCYISKAGLKMHRTRAHHGAEGGSAPCTECDGVFETREELAVHMKTFQHKELRCNRCSKTFLKRQTFVAHTLIHPQYVFKCATCLQTFAEGAELDEHAATHKVAENAACGNAAQRTDAQVEQFQRMKFEYCLSYVGLVKSMFACQPDRYMAFLDTIKEFKFQKLTVESLLVRISHLFKDHRELIAGFNTFMPHGFKIELPSEDKKGVAVCEGRPDNRSAEDPAPAQGPDMDLDYSLSYLSQIKSMFATQPQIYNDFTYIIKEYKLKTMEIPEVIRRVSHLFRDYPELIAGFNSFLPPWCKINVSLSVKKEKEDIDPLASGSSAPHAPSAQHNGESSSKARPGCADSATPALMPPGQSAAGGKRAKRRTSSAAAPAAAPPVAKRVKMEVIASDAYKPPDQAPADGADPPDPDPGQEKEVTEYASCRARPESIVDTVNSLCDQLQTIVDEAAGQAQAQQPAEVFAHVCHVCLKSFQKKPALLEHVKLHQMRS